jgi:type IV pilus assembly protein PilA
MGRPSCVRRRSPLREDRAQTDIRSVTTKRFPLAPALLLALVVGGVSCGGRPFPKAKSAPPVVTGAAASPRARLLAAAQHATAEKTARLAVRMAVSGRGQAVLTFTGSGVIDLTRARMTMAAHIVGSGETSEVEMRIVDRMAYVHAAGVWESISLARTGAADLLPDPTSYIDFLQGAADDVHVVGHDTLRGDATTHYRATLDLARALARTGDAPASRTVIRAAIALLGTRPIPVSVWVDGLGRLRKLTLSIDLADAAKQLGFARDVAPKIDATVELYDFGVPVAVQVPAGAVSALTRAQDRAVQSDLRNALTAEKVQYTDTEAYSADVTLLKQIEPSLDWGGKLTVVARTASGASPQVVCVSERSAAGTTFALADIASGPGAGTFYGKHACPPVVNASSFRDFGASW